MRTSEEQLIIVKERARRLQRRATVRRAVTISSLATAACIALAIVVVQHLSGLEGTSYQSAPQAYGSLVLADHALGYVIVGALCFALGICATLLCFYLRMYHKISKDD